MKSKMFFNNTKAVGPLEEGGESTGTLKELWLYFEELQPISS